MRLEGCGRDTTSHSRGAMRPSLAKILTPRRSEGAGNAGRAMRPKPRMQNKTSIRVSHHGHTGTTRHSPRKGEYWHKNLQYINAMRLMCPPWCHFEIDAQEKPYKVGAARRWPASAASARPNQPPPGRRRWLAAGAMGS